MGVFARLFSYNERELARYRKTVDAVNALEPEMRRRSDRELAATTVRLKQRLAAGETLDAVLPEAYAAVRETARRVLGERPFDVQLVGAIALHEGRISEMKTGEGKTLTATMPLYLNALAGRGVHLVTTNDFLVRWQAEWMGRIYQFLGLTVGFIQHDMPPWVRAEMYGCDVTYVQNSELGFDYLRDNMALDREQLVLRDLYYAIVDEVDSILIDEARTPLILSGPQEESTDLYRRVNEVIARLTPGHKDEDGTEHGDYIVDEKMHTCHLTEVGQSKTEKALGVANIAAEGGLELQHHVQAALKAHTLFHRDKEYIVKNGEVVIVDEFTGHLQPGRRYSDGIHQAIEAKEGVTIREEQQTVATITYQNFFRLYEKLAGMTGTAKTEEAEFQRIYNMPVIVVPPNKKVARRDHSDVVYKTQEAKFRGIITDIVRCKTLGQPVLVGTRNVDVSELIARRLLREKVQLLALVSVLQDEILRRKDLRRADRDEWLQTLRLPLDEQLPAGTPEFAEEEEGEEEEGGSRRDRKRARRTLAPAAAVKIARALDLPTSALDAANLDRLLDLWQVVPANAGAEERSALAMRLATVLQEDKAINPLNAKFHDREAEVIREAGRAGYVTIATNMAGRGVDIRLGGAPEEGEDRSAEYDEVKQVGGLHVVGTERHESRRIDNQLRGRSGRQGDPGSSRFFVSLEDELMRIFAPERMRFLTSGWPEEEPVETRLITRTIERAQYKVEVRNFGIRKHTLQYDNVMNEQRSVIYANRRRVLMGEDVGDSIRSMVDRVVEEAIRSYASPNVDAEQWNLEDLCTSLRDSIPGLVERLAQESLEDAIADGLGEALEEVAAGAYGEELQWAARLAERTVLQAAADYRDAGGATVQGAPERLVAEAEALAPGAAARVSAVDAATLDGPALDAALQQAVREALQSQDGRAQAALAALRSRLRKVAPSRRPRGETGQPDVAPAAQEAAAAVNEQRKHFLEEVTERFRQAALSPERREALLQACLQRLQALEQERGLADRLAREVVAAAVARVFGRRARTLYEDERQWHERVLERRLREVVKAHEKTRPASKESEEEPEEEAPAEFDLEALRRDCDYIVPGLPEMLTDELLDMTEPHELPETIAALGVRVYRERDESQAGQRLESLQGRVEGAVRSHARLDRPAAEWDLNLFLEKVGEVEGEMRSMLSEEALRRVRNSRLAAELKDPAGNEYSARALAVRGPWGLRRRFALETLRGLPPGQLADQIKRRAHDFYEARTRRLGADNMRHLERRALLRAIEASWPQHLQDMEHLNEAVRLRAYGQWDPLVQYQKEGYEYFQRLLSRIAHDVTTLVYGSEFVVQPTQRRAPVAQPVARLPAPADASRGESPAPPRPDRLPKPDQRCWCGSGRKYKNCHLAEDLAVVAGS